VTPAPVTVAILSPIPAPPTVNTLFEEGWSGLWKKHLHQQAAAH